MENNASANQIPQLSEKEFRQKVEKVMERVRVYIQSDGGDVELVNVNEEDGLVFVRLQGACTSCPSSIYTLHMGIENELKAEIPQVKQVIAV